MKYLFWEGICYIEWNCGWQHSLIDSLWICEGLNLWVNSSRSEYVTEKVISMSNKQMDVNQKCLMAWRCPGVLRPVIVLIAAFCLVHSSMLLGMKSNHQTGQHCAWTLCLLPWADVLNCLQVSFHFLLCTDFVLQFTFVMPRIVLLFEDLASYWWWRGQG